MHRPSTNDQADLVLLAILFFFLVLYSSSLADGSQNATQRHDLPQTIATTEMLVIFGTAI